MHYCSLIAYFSIAIICYFYQAIGKCIIYVGSLYAENLNNILCCYNVKHESIFCGAAIMWSIKEYFVCDRRNNSLLARLVLLYKVTIPHHIWWHGIEKAKLIQFSPTSHYFILGTNILSTLFWKKKRGVKIIVHILSYQIVQKKAEDSELHGTKHSPNLVCI